MPRLVRRQSVRARILSYLNPLDLALDLYTYIESYDWEGVQSTTSTPIGLTLNFLLLVSRVNCTTGVSTAYEDVLRTTTSGRSYNMRWASGNKSGHLLNYLSWILAFISVMNSLLCFTKKKRYRMFESNIDIEPSTPNARRVPVDSSPSANGISAFLSPSKLRQTREYTSTTDVWEISVWDPTPISLKLFSLFSPVHCAVYFLMFPITAASSQLFPNSLGGTAAYLTALVIQAVLSLQLGQLISAFTQQTKDKAVVQKEVLKEYDNKFVHPRLNILKRDVATQTKDDHFEASVEIYTPVFNRQGFVTHPNPNYEHFTSGYSTTSGLGVPVSAMTPQVERQLRREQNPDYSSVPRFSRFIKQEPLDEESPTKPEWSMKPRRFGTINRNTTTAPRVSSAGTNTEQDQRERERKEQRDSRERVKRGSDAFSTIYPDLEDEEHDYQDKKDRDYNQSSGSALAPLNKSNNVILNTPSLQPTKRRSGLDDNVFNSSPGRSSSLSQDRIRGDIGTPRRPTFIGMGGASASTAGGRGNNVGMNGLVNMAVENSRSLSPTKSPIKGRARPSSYAASLGKGVFGTPKR